MPAALPSLRMISTQPSDSGFDVIIITGDDSKASSEKTTHPSQELIEINIKLDKIMKALDIEP